MSSRSPTPVPSVSPTPLESNGPSAIEDDTVAIAVLLGVVFVAVFVLMFFWIYANLRSSSSASGGGGGEPRIQKVADGPVMLFHQTDAIAASTILGTQKFIPGSSGSAGPGIYFATSAADTNRKARQKGVVLSATVDLGMTLVIETANSHLTAESVTAVGADSVLMTCFHGAEYVIYDSSRISNIELCCGDMKVDRLPEGYKPPPPPVPLQGAVKWKTRPATPKAPGVPQRGPIGAPVLLTPTAAQFMVQQPPARAHHIVDVAMQPDRDDGQQRNAHRGGRRHRSRSTGRPYRHFTPPLQERVEPSSVPHSDAVAELAPVSTLPAAERVTYNFNTNRQPPTLTVPTPYV